MEIRIGKHEPELIKGKERSLSTSKKPGRYPYWEHVGNELVNLDKDIFFEADMRVEIKNTKKAGLFGLSGKILGFFLVPLHTITKRVDKPQFYNLINDEG